MSIRIAVVYEAEADFRTATELADRILCDTIDWLEESHLDSHRIWIMENVQGQRLTWKGIKKLARGRVPARGHFDGEPGMPDAMAARRAIQYAIREFDELQSVMLIRDQDDQPERRQGLEQAKFEIGASLPIVIGLCIVERESWVVAGFDPRTDEERSRLEIVRQELGFHPHEKSQELTASKRDDAKKSPKRILKILTCGDAERERSCWSHTDLSKLNERGEANGLRQFMNEVRDFLAPLFGHKPRSFRA